ncbi:MAG: hypothetical protein WD378_02110 [Egicoccus sp.]
MTRTLFAEEGYSHEGVRAACIAAGLDEHEAEAAASVHVARHGVPTILAGGVPLHEANEWLLKRWFERRDDNNIKKEASRLAAWIRFLRNHPTDPVGVHGATEQHYRDYEVAKRYPEEITERSIHAAALPPRDHDRFVAGRLRLQPVSSSWWRSTKFIIREFHRHLEAGWRTPFPFTLEPFRKHNGSQGLRMPDAGSLGDDGSDTRPLSPATFETLLDSLTGNTPQGWERMMAMRDVALAQWLVATGQRIEAASLMTIYEVPDISPTARNAIERRPGIVPWSDPRAINKSSRWNLADAFAGRLVAVDDWVNGDRQDIVDRTPRYRPKHPLSVLRADFERVTYSDGTARPVTQEWNTVDARIRRRLVDQHGRCVLLWINQHGTPVAVRTIQDVFAKAADRANLNDPRFPSRVFPHMLRHTYATWMGALYWLGDPELYEDGVEPRRFHRVGSAIEFVSHELNHVSEKTTRIYTKYLAAMLRTEQMTPAIIKGQFA